jgi:hypothetical protein
MVKKAPGLHGYKQASKEKVTVCIDIGTSIIFYIIIGINREAT